MTLMDLGRLKQATGTERPNPSVPMLETVVRSYSAQLTKLDSELTSAIFQVTGEMGELTISSASTTSTLTFLASQLAMLSDLLARKMQAPAPEPNPAPPAPETPEGESLDPRWEPSLPPPERYSGDFDKCLGFLEECHNVVSCQPSRFWSDGAKVALIITSLTDRALDWTVAVMG